jgi:hypothetical protein
MVNMVEYRVMNIGGKDFLVRKKRINHADLTTECWPVQIWGLQYCSGFGNPDNICEYLDTEECGGIRIREIILAGKYPENGLPDAGMNE